MKLMSCVEGEYNTAFWYSIFGQLEIILRK